MLRQNLQTALENFSAQPLPTAALAFWKTLGYSSNVTAEVPTDFAGFCESLELQLRPERVLASQWNAIHFLFQLDSDSLQNAPSLFERQTDFNAEKSYLFFALDLGRLKSQPMGTSTFVDAGPMSAKADNPTGCDFSRSQLATLARELNSQFDSPILLLVKTPELLHLAVVDRRPNKTDSSKTVLEKVTLIRDINPQNPHRGHLDILARLELSNLNAKNWEQLHAAWKTVLDTQTLNAAFYRDYKVVFDLVERSAVLSPELENTRREWTQRLFNRLIFLRFLEKKGWLQFEGDTDYLRALWNDSQKKGDDFLNDRLFYAFFYGLGVARYDSKTSETDIHSSEFLVQKRGVVPFLNGGLFEALEHSDTQGAASFPNQGEVFEAILGLFERYYFTVSENTPLEEEVGVDPEMLGKVFEELVTGRHESGSYYTPRPIVAFMAREALKGYLGGGEAIEKFVDENDPSGLSDPEAILQKLREVTICDPACGSGAYLLGTMQELLRLRETLFAAKARDHQKIYDRKLEIISQNIYGVDLDPFAVQIAMLRLWLSLVIEYGGPTPPPLPNLNYKIEVGDSLSQPILGEKLTLDAEQARRFSDAKSQFLRAHGEAKKAAQARVEDELSAMYSWQPYADQAGGFCWNVEFAEVFARGGFDIVLANPPYIRMELFKEQKPTLKRNFPFIHAERADLYVYFYGRAFEILKPGGMLSFITPNKWFRAAYGAGLRSLFAEQSHVETIVDFGELPVFQAAATFPMIFVAQKRTQGAAQKSTRFAQVKDLGAPYPNVLKLVKTLGASLPPSAISGENWNLSDANSFARLEKMRKSGTPLGEYVKGQIFYGVKTGFNEAFVIDGATRARLIAADARSEELIKPMAKGDDVRRWRIDKKDRFLIYVPKGTDLQGYPAVLAHLLPFKAALDSRATKQEWYELQQAQLRFVPFMEKSKIIFPDIAKESRFTLDAQSHYPTNTCYFLGSDELYLLGVLNSSAVWEYASGNLTVLGDADKGGRLRFFTQFVQNIPIPTPSSSERSAIETLVSTCLSRRGQGCGDEENEINARVAALYGL